MEPEGLVRPVRVPWVGLGRVLGWEQGQLQAEVQVQLGSERAKHVKIKILSWKSTYELLKVQLVTAYYVYNL